MTLERVVRLTGGPAGSGAALPWPADTDWPDELWAAPVEDAATGDRAVMFSPEPLPGLSLYRKVRQSSLPDSVVDGVRIVRGAEYEYAPPGLFDDVTTNEIAGDP